MAAPSNAERSPERSAPLKTPKTELPSPESDELSDGNQYHSDPSAPSRFPSLNVSISALGAGGGSASASNNSSSVAGGGGFTVCRGMSWTPSETNALIAVWGNERLAEARMQQLEVAGTVFSGKAPGPAMYERVSRALSELGYDRTPSQCRERMKTLRRCYSRVKEHGIGKRKSSYSIEQLEKVFGQGGWDSQSCQPVLINSSGLYQEMESDGSTMEDYPQEDWCSQDLSAAFQEGEIEAEEIQLPKNRVLQLRPDASEHAQLDVRMKRESFWEKMDEVVESILREERMLIGADFNGHVGKGNRIDEDVMDRYGASGSDEECGTHTGISGRQMGALPDVDRLLTLAPL
ncbi:myb/SANT-like DNA-binding domain-containing protein 2 isoform X3 [Neoarius graeffei]|uniref:myb/SANT-like DNA-binding domain-containing protein 2 isoform X3 n=1 Tax=Neoarius graeffei TaxID=443677 RepID=UPI00298D463B|nr:myb/SANT-like DNA-binding domain-containing protein 2 isoform X3 [Neoarius graeffei]